MRAPIAAALAVLMLLQSACGAGWRQPPAFPTGALAPRQQAQVWTHGRALQWHAIRITADSVSGVPFLRSIDCDSCRVGIARAEVDSLRLGDPAGGLAQSVALFLGGGLVLMYAGCFLFRACPVYD